MVSPHSLVCASLRGGGSILLGGASADVPPSIRNLSGGTSEQETNPSSKRFEMRSNTVADHRVLLPHLVFVKSHPQAQSSGLPLHAGGLSNGFDICSVDARPRSFRFSNPQGKKGIP